MIVFELFHRHTQKVEYSDGKKHRIVYALCKPRYLLLHLIGRLVKLTPVFSASI